LDVSEAASSPLFNNEDIKRRLSPENIQVGERIRGREYLVNLIQWKMLNGIMVYVIVRFIQSN
jgi:hypothetical protein